MEQIIIYDLPFNAPTLHEIENIIRQAGPIVSPFNRFDQYNFLEYAKERDVHNSQFHALFDLNVTLNVLRLARLKVADQSMRETAALLSLLIITDTIFEISFGMIEYAQRNSESSSCESINLFRAADNVSPSIYADIALNRKTRLIESDLPKIKNNHVSFNPEVHYNWHMHYMGLLGLVVLNKGSGRPVDKVCKYLEWMWSDFVFSAPCILFSLIYLSNKTFKGMFKDIGSGKQDLVLNGIRNAAWDLATVYYWSSRVTETVASENIWIFCTFDKALREIASNLITNCDEQYDIESISYFLSSYWSNESTNRIIDRYCDLNSKAKDPCRRINQVATQKDLLAKIPELERMATEG